MMNINKLQEVNFLRNQNFAISLKANLLNLNSAYYFVLGNFSMTAHIIKIEKSEFANMKFREIALSQPGR